MIKLFSNGEEHLFNQVVINVSKHGLALQNLRPTIIMASNVPYSQENELLNSGSDEEDSDDISETATRTRSKKKARVPRPIEPNVQVQNDQENAGRSGEVSEDRDLGYGDIWSANKVIQTEREYNTFIYVRLYMQCLRVDTNNSYQRDALNLFVVLYQNL